MKIQPFQESENYKAYRLSEFGSFTFYTATNELFFYGVLTLSDIPTLLNILKHNHGLDLHSPDDIKNESPKTSEYLLKIADTLLNRFEGRAFGPMGMLLTELEKYYESKMADLRGNLSELKMATLAAGRPPYPKHRVEKLEAENLALQQSLKTQMDVNAELKLVIEKQREELQAKINTGIVSHVVKLEMTDGRSKYAKQIIPGMTYLIPLIGYENKPSFDFRAALKQAFHAKDVEYVGVRRVYMEYTELSGEIQAPLTPPATEEDDMLPL